MISGIGVDIVEVARLSRAIEKYPTSFIRFVYTEKERKLAEIRKNSIQFYAGRWAAKEAYVKALGVGIGHQCHWLDIEILNDPHGKPYIKVEGRGLETAQKLNAQVTHLSISHEPTVACAFVVIEKN